MKKRVLFIFLFLILSSFIFSNFVFAESGIPGVGDDATAKGIIDAVDGIPIGPDGQINQSKFIPYRSKAEERIDAINLWLDKNASWLRIVFGMVPSLSWEFFINLAIIIFFLYLFVFALTDFLPYSKGTSTIVGSGFFIVLLLFKFPAKIAIAIGEIMDQWWFKLSVIIGIGILITLSGFLSKIEKKKKENVQKYRESLRRARAEGATKVLETYTKAITED